eukprot:2647_1
MQSNVLLINSLINELCETLNQTTMNNNIDNISKKNMGKLISYFSRNLKMKNLMHSDVIQLIYDYQRVVLYYQLPNIPVHHPCVQAFKLDLCENQILIQVASLFFIFDTKTCKYEAVCRLFKDIQQDYGYHVIHIPQQNKLYLFHGNTETVSVQELIYNEKCKLIGSKHCLKMYSKTMFGLRSIVLNDEYFLIFCNGMDDNTKVTVYNYIINNDITLPLLDMSNDFKFKSCGLVLLKKNEFLVFGNDAMYEIKVTFLRNMYAFNIFPQFDIKKIDNELFKDDFILHEFGYALCDKYILIFGGNYSNDSANPIFSDDIYIYNVKTNRWFKSKK